MEMKHENVVVLIILLSLILSNSVSFSKPQPLNTFSLSLYHKPSPSTSTPKSLFQALLQHDRRRVQSLSARAAGTASSSMFSGYDQGISEYFTRLGVGTPQQTSELLVDTGSDIVWLQCIPCTKCYHQTDPIFDPTKSSSFSLVTCADQRCRQLEPPGCDSHKKRCIYSVFYGDGSSTTGELSTETLSFGKTTFENIAIGCGHRNKGVYRGVGGLLGLGRGNLSFITQAGWNKFSYCMVDRFSNKSSPILFGDKAVIRNTVFTRMIKNPKASTFYYVGLNGFSVGSARVHIPEAVFKLDDKGKGGVIIDSGTTITWLAKAAYKPFRDAFRAAALELKLPRPFNILPFDTCYNFTCQAEVKVAKVVLHFDGGAHVELLPKNYLVQVDDEGEVFCFAFAAIEGLSIIGNIQQQGFRVVYDLAGSRVGFAADSC